MSQENVKVIREAFERWNRRDIDYWIQHAHPQVEVWSKYAALDQGGEPYHGHEGMREWRAEIDRNFEFHQVLAEDVRDVEGKVLVLGAVPSEARSVAPRCSTRSDGYVRCAAARWCACSSTRATRRPSKLPGCGSRALSSRPTGRILWMRRHGGVGVRTSFTDF
jgi:ketosteroid isomerase-like protein